MNNIDWVLHQEVGFYFLNRKWKDEIYTYIVEHSIPTSIYQCRNGKDEAYIYYKDGKKIRFIPASSAARGYKFTQIGYEPGISEEIFDNIIDRALIIKCIEIEGIND